MKSFPIPGIYFKRSHEVLHVWSDTPLSVLSTAVVGAELATTRHILNMHVPDHYNNDNPADDLISLAAGLGISEPFIGLMTAAWLERAQVVYESGAGTTLAAILTVGLSHPVAAGVSQAAFDPIPTGTINTILIVDASLTPAARANAIITATEAKTLALVEAGIRTSQGGFATGTGTDSVVIASTQRGPTFECAGPVAPLGALIGRAVRQAMQNAIILRNLFNRPLA